MHAAGPISTQKRDRDLLATICGATGLGTCILVIIADLTTAAIYKRLGLFADTISAMAAGRGAAIMDTALVILACGIGAIAFGLFRTKPDGTRWIAGLFALVTVAGIIAAIAIFNEYGDGDQQDSWTFHYRLVYALGIAFLTVLVLTAHVVKSMDRRLWVGSYVLALAWLAAGLLMFAIPTAWDGLVERIAAVCMLLWLMGASLFLIWQPQAA